MLEGHASPPSTAAAECAFAALYRGPLRSVAVRRSNCETANDGESYSCALTNASNHDAC
jgi:hypothetical protein